MTNSGKKMLKFYKRIINIEKIMMKYYKKDKYRKDYEELLKENDLNKKIIMIY